MLLNFKSFYYWCEPDKMVKIDLSDLKLIRLNQTFHYTRHITWKRVTSLRCPSPRYSAKETQQPVYMLKQWRTVCNVVKDLASPWGSNSDIPHTRHACYKLLFMSAICNHNRTRFTGLQNKLLDAVAFSHLQIISRIA